ncbi:tetraacyldisaccharide 4'-kinase [Hyphococcus sp.]|uniref:tetraacyldisaccharide 4'-kinase n=1 Tax=Hyphococcus sp. TaxID=2038636 RepID=UPI003D132D6D
MREPWFWRSETIAARSLRMALAPVASLYQAGYQTRLALAKPQRASVPVICIGNATLGGTGKTPFAMLVSDMLKEEGVKPFFLTRGFRGAEAGPLVVDPDKHDACDVGDEALLLSQRAKTIVARDRPKGAALAAKEGADAIIMDDGFQNPSLTKDLSVLLIGEDDSGALFPAGPFRESLDHAKARAQITVAMGRDKSSADFRAWLEPINPAPERVIAFAGIGKPEKFFKTLEDAGYDLVQRVGFPDHHIYTEAEERFLAREGRREKARLICTEKDAVKLTPEFRADVLTLPVRMRVDDPAALKRRLMAVINEGRKGRAA